MGRREWRLEWLHVMLIYPFSLTKVTGNKDCSPDHCLFNRFNPLDIGEEAPDECCVYFRSGCCTPTENSFLHTM